MASPTGASTSSVLLLLLLVALAGLADLAAAARPVDAALPTTNTMASPAGELDGMMQCMVGCFTQVLGCAIGCMGKGPDLPLCVISCNQKSIVCMVRCGISPSPPAPKPTPPAPTPTPPKPKPPKPSPPKPKPAPPPGPPYSGHSTETSA